MSIVLDNSSTMAWVFPDETTPAIDVVFERVEREGAWVPSIWHLEVANVLHMAVRSKRYTAIFRDRALAALSVLPIDVEQTRSTQIWNEILQLAEQHDLTVYDATYLELAARRNLALATLDGKLRTAAEREGLLVLGF